MIPMDEYRYPEWNKRHARIPSSVRMDRLDQSERVRRPCHDGRHQLGRRYRHHARFARSRSATEGGRRRRRVARSAVDGRRESASGIAYSVRLNGIRETEKLSACRLSSGELGSRSPFKPENPATYHSRRRPSKPELDRPSSASGCTRPVHAHRVSREVKLPEAAENAPSRQVRGNGIRETVRCP